MERVVLRGEMVWNEGCRHEDAESLCLLGVDLMLKERLSCLSCLSYFSLTHLQIWTYHLTHI